MMISIHPNFLNPGHSQHMIPTTIAVGPASPRLTFPTVSEMTALSSVLPQYITTLGKKVDMAEQAKDTTPYRSNMLDWDGVVDNI